MPPAQAFYVDEAFPPDRSSLGANLAGELTWRRPGDFPDAFASRADSESDAFAGCGEPHPDDVRPCPLGGDASLSCAISALAERPHLVRSVLGLARCSSEPSRRHRRGGERNPRKRHRGGDAGAKAGLFTARLCVEGAWREYVMDDFFPCYPGGKGGMCLSRAHGPGLWVSMLEKAYARAAGSYSAAIGGTACWGSRDKEASPGAGMRRWEQLVARPAEVLGVFTGAPSVHVPFEGIGGDELGGCSGGGVVDLWGRGSGEERGEEGKREGISAEELWRRVVSALRHMQNAGNLIACLCRVDPGLREGHPPFPPPPLAGKASPRCMTLDSKWELTGLGTGRGACRYQACLRQGTSRGRLDAYMGTARWSLGP